ncbi:MULTISPECIES: DNA repair protein RecO [unclassified Sphingomonas]|jgi:DNA repair protein RecO (recombination protein O)|uniref:DNA repair protein RecO n=1 Tax=unclassified Sphingomonas TaxID=196159 RepID=UPI000E10A8D1|nr:MULTISPECIES: DNA repair protein RecO [unclassified Sphingomonas]AXJ94812.1 DNA repair protein RecO [Sphingomonas sp. FARSPH]
MHRVAEALVLAVRVHGEHGAVVRALTRDDGVQPGYVRGGRSRALRPILQPANTIRGEWRARTGEQLAALTVEPLHSRAALHSQPLPAAALAWVAAFTAAALPEAQPYPRVHDALSGLLDAIEAAPSARGWAAALARYELLLLAELGFGLDLSACIVTGASDDLAFVSPKSGGAVCAGAASGYERRLFPLPAFLRDGGSADWPEVFDGLRITGHFLARDLLVDRRVDAMAARARLVDLMQRAVA